MRPSIEMLLHTFLPHVSVIHSHADTILLITNTRRPHDNIAIRGDRLEIQASAKVKNNDLEKK